MKHHLGIYSDWVEAAKRQAGLYPLALPGEETKYCNLLGTSLAGVVNFEDRVALQYLRSRSDVRSGPRGCIGLSGGGCRAALLQAACDDIGASVVVGMMTIANATDTSRDFLLHAWTWSSESWW